MRIAATSIFVDDQHRALKLYTEVLGFQRKKMSPVGKNLWLTVVSPSDPDGLKLLLEPCEHPAVNPFRNALAEDGIPSLQLTTKDVELEFARLQRKGVQFIQEPARMGGIATAVFDDTCGNLIQIVSEN